MIEGYSFSPPDGGAPMHTISNGNFKASFVVYEDTVLIAVAKTVGTDLVEVNTCVLDRSELRRWAGLARERTVTARMSPPEHAVKSGQPCVILIPATERFPAIVMFSDKRWVDAEGRYDGLKVAVNLAEHLGGRHDIGALIP